MTVNETTRWLRSHLIPIVGEGEATAVGRLIFYALKGWEATDLVIHAADEVSPFIEKRIEEILSRLTGHEPIQYILGHARFFGMDLEVNRSTLIPRHETEELVDIIILDAGNRADLSVLDIGTGSGAIAIALSRNLRFPEITAIELSQEALATARRNAERLHAQIKFFHADIFDRNLPLTSDSFDIIVSNPPYVTRKEMKDMEPEVIDHEPHSAIFVPDEDPLLFYRRIAEFAIEVLNEEGKLYFEINPLYASETRKMMESFGYSDIEIIKDISNRNRFLKATFRKRSKR